MRCLRICLFINFFVCLHAKGQQLLPQVAGKKMESGNINHPFASSSYTKDDKTVPVVFYNAPVKVISPDYYNSTLGFFCKKEIQMEKALKFPLKFRLGSVAYTDKMEGKASAVPLPAYH